MKLLSSAGLAHFWGRVSQALEGKQDRLTGSAGQLVGFDAQGRAAAVSAEYVTAQELDAAIAGAVTEAMEAVY